MQFDTTTGEFTAIVKIDTSIKEPTVVYMHKDDANPETAWYPNGYSWTVEAAEEGPQPDFDTVDMGSNAGAFIVKNDEFNGRLLKFHLVAKSASEE